MVAVQGVPALIEVLGTQITIRFALRLNGARGEEVVPTCADRVGSPDPNENLRRSVFR